MMRGVRRLLMSLLIRWVVVALGLLLVAAILPGVAISGFMTALIAALVFGLVNLMVKPLVSLLTLPINMMTLGLFSFVINALMFGLTAWLVPGFIVTGIWSALLGSVLLSIITSVAHMLTGQVLRT
jgi:putative membrane protein